MEKRIAVYLRVSTRDQSTELQSKDIKEYVRARGWPHATMYEDSGCTGTNDRRPELQRLLRDARSRQIDVVICWKLDRLFRSLKHLVNTLQEFEELGIKFISLKDQIDLTTSAGRLMVHMLAAFGEFEASLIRERVRAGLRAAKAKGKRLGRPKTRDDLRIHQLRCQGLSIRKIASTTGVSSASVQRSLKARGMLSD